MVHDVPLKVSSDFEVAADAAGLQALIDRARNNVRARGCTPSISW